MVGPADLRAEKVEQFKDSEQVLVHLFKDVYWASTMYQ